MTYELVIRPVPRGAVTARGTDVLGIADPCDVGDVVTALLEMWRSVDPGGVLPWDASSVQQMHSVATVLVAAADELDQPGLGLGELRVRAAATARALRVAAQELDDIACADGHNDSGRNA